VKSEKLPWKLTHSRGEEHEKKTPPPCDGGVGSRAILTRDVGAQPAIAAWFWMFVRHCEVFPFILRHVTESNHGLFIKFACSAEVHLWRIKIHNPKTCNLNVYDFSLSNGTLCVWWIGIFTLYRIHQSSKNTVSTNSHILSNWAGFKFSLISNAIKKSFVSTLDDISTSNGKSCISIDTVDAPQNCLCSCVVHVFWGGLGSWANQIFCCSNCVAKNATMSPFTIVGIVNLVPLFCSNDEFRYARNFRWWRFAWTYERLVLNPVVRKFFINTTLVSVFD